MIWTLNIQCPRPPNRTVDECHTRPDRLARRVATLLGPDATVTLTPRRVRLVVTGTDAPPDIGQWQAQLALLLHSVYLGRSSTDLPTPVRTEIRQDRPTIQHPTKGPS